MSSRFHPGLALIALLPILACRPAFAPAPTPAQHGGTTPLPSQGAPASPTPPASPGPSLIPSPVASGSLSYTARAFPPAADGGPRIYGHNWYNGDPVVFKDSAGGDLVGFFVGDDSLLALASSDAGKSWRTIRPSPDIPIPVCDALCQGPDGKVHIVGSTYLESIYARLSLQRDPDGKVAGFSSDIPAASGYRIELPMIDNMNFGRWNVIAGSDGAGSPRLFVAAYCGPDYPDTTPYGQVKAMASSVASGYAPSSTADWVKLDDAAAPGATVVYATASSTETPHSTGAHIAQQPLSKDLWFEWGPLDTFHDSVNDQDPVRRLRALPSGSHAWSLGSPSVVATFSSAASSGYGYQCQHYALRASAEYVWAAHLEPDTGLEIDRIDRYGTVLRNAIPAPAEFSGECLGSFVAFSVSADSGRAWLGVWRSEDSRTAPYGCYAACWDGSAWTVFGDADLADSDGVGGSVGWDSGLVIVTTNASGSAEPKKIALATIREE